ncbi:MAG: D-alanyl-D-alanine carboxypeptidase [Desulfobacteraceae bacterium]|nr:D-alanyl-D-alanine carboxypeptidase [Desulfobacteraceae bacterium]
MLDNLKALKMRGVCKGVSVFGLHLIAILCLIAVYPRPSLAYEPYVSAKAAVIMDAKTGKILYAKNPHLELPPASTTKIITTLVALDRLKLNDTAVASYRASMAEPSKIGLHPGDRMTVNDLLYSIMLKSANDASVVVAEKAAGGSISRFAGMMNEKARQLGAVDTHFSNPNGLPCANHYTTAYDLAVMFRKAEENPLFAKITSTKFASVKIRSGSGRVKKLNLQNHNKLLWTFKGADGGKTGYTHAAMHCYAGMVSRGGKELVVTMLGSADNWKDVNRLLAYGLNLPYKSYIARNQIGKNTHYAKGVRKSGHAVVTARRSVKTRKNRMGRRYKTYTIQVAAFKKASYAKKLTTKLAKDGYKVKLKNVNDVYKVIIGEHGTHRQAEKVLTLVENKYDVRPMLLDHHGKVMRN